MTCPILPPSKEEILQVKHYIREETVQSIWICPQRPNNWWQPKKLTCKLGRTLSLHSGTPGYNVKSTLTFPLKTLLGLPKRKGGDTLPRTSTCSPTYSSCKHLLVQDFPKAMAQRSAACCSLSTRNCRNALSHEPGMLPVLTELPISDELWALLAPGVKFSMKVKMLTCGSV